MGENHIDAADMRMQAGQRMLVAFDGIDQEMTDALIEFVPHLQAMLRAMNNVPLHSRLSILMGMVVSAAFDEDKE